MRFAADRMLAADANTTVAGGPFGEGRTTER